MGAAANIKAGAAYVELFTQDNRLVRGLISAQKKLKAFSASATRIGKKLMATSLIMAMPFAIGVKAAASFEEEMANVSTMLDQPEKHMKRLTRGVRDMSIQFGEGTDTLAKGLYDILSASIPAEKALYVLSVSAKAARAGLTDTGVAADAITTVLNAYGMSAEKAGDVSDWLFSIVKKGKCVTGDTRVLLANGEYRRIDSLCGDVQVVSWDGRNFTPAMARWCDMGKKRIVRMRTSFGREIRTTPEHPYLTPDGWRPVDQLKVGDKIALPVTLPFFGTKHAPEGWPALLGYLISEGSILGNSPRVTTTIPKVVAELEASAKALGCELHQVKQQPGKAPSYDIVAGYRGHSGGNPVIDKLREYGLWGKNCYGKFIPEECFSWRKEDLALLLRALFTGDGWLAPSRRNRNFQLGYCSVSRRLVEDIAHLLLRFGIVTRVVKTSINAWMLESKRYVDIRRFLDFIGIERENVKLFNDYHPTYNRERLKELTSYGKTPRNDNKLYQPYRGCGVRDFHQPIFFDRITEIEELPEERVYDLCVPVLHNFVANDIVAHNTTFAELAPSIGLVATTAASAGVDLNEFGAAIATMTRNGVRTENAVTALNAIIATFLKPTDDAAKYAKKLGFELSSTTLKTIGLKGVFEKIAKLPPDAISKLFPNKRAIRGVLPALQNMSGFAEDLKTMQNRAGAADRAYAKMSKTLSLALARMKQAGIAVFVEIGNALSGSIKDISKTVVRYMGLIRDWIANNKKVVKTALKIVGAIALAGAALITIGAIGQTVAFVFGGIAAIITGVGTAISIMGAILGAILSPIGLVTVAVVALGAAILYYSGLGGKMLGWLGEKFKELSSFASAAFQGIKDALVAGDFSLAANILWKSLQIAWLAGINELKKLWIEFKSWYQKTTSEIFYGALSIITDSWASLKTTWTNTVSYLLDVWNIFIKNLKSAWNASQSFLQKRWLDLMGLFDSSLDVDAAKKLVDAESKMLEKEAQTELDNALKSSSAQSNKDKADIEKERKDKQAMIEQQMGTDMKGIETENAESLRKSREELDKAKAEWKKAIDEAKSKRAESGKLKDSKGKDFSLDDVKAAMKGASSQIAAVKGKVEVAGTFYADAVRSLSSGNAADRTAKATEDIKKNTKKTNQLLQKQSSSELVYE